jgi:hypothetical protein
LDVFFLQAVLPLIHCSRGEQRGRESFQISDNASLDEVGLNAKKEKRLTSLILVMALLLGFSQSIGAATLFPNPSRGWNKIPRIVVSGKEGDPRIPLVIEAVDFWNKQLEGEA